MRVECGNPVVRSVIVGDQLISERDQVDEDIAKYFQEVYAGGEHQEYTSEDEAMWTRIEAAVDVT